MTCFLRDCIFATPRCVILAVALLGVGRLGVVMAADEENKGNAADLLAGDGLAKHWTTSGNWIKEGDGVVTLKPRPGERGWERYDSYLWLTAGDFADFRCEFEYRVQKGSNSGFYFHVGNIKSPVATGIEVQIFDSFGRPPDKLTDHDSGGIIPSVPPTRNAAKPVGEWNRMVVTCRGKTVTVELNNVIVNQVDLSQGQLATLPKSGAIGFQDHALPLSLRRITLQKL